MLGGGGGSPAPGRGIPHPPSARPVKSNMSAYNRDNISMRVLHPPTAKGGARIGAVRLTKSITF